MPQNPNRDYEKEGKWQASPEQKKRRAERNKLRREAMKKGLVHKGDGLELDHGKVGHGKALPNSGRVVTKKANRASQPKRK